MKKFTLMLLVALVGCGANLSAVKGGYFDRRALENKRKGELIAHIKELDRSWRIHLDAKDTAKRIDSAEMRDQVLENMIDLVKRKEDAVKELKALNKGFVSRNTKDIVPKLLEIMLLWAETNNFIQPAHQLKRQKSD